MACHFELELREIPLVVVGVNLHLIQQSHVIVGGVSASVALVGWVQHF